MQSLKLFTASVLAASAAAEMKPGACPVRDSNKSMEKFNMYHMTGLWYEYLWDEAYTNYDYECSTWIVLADTEKGEDAYAVYNNMLFPAEEEGGEREPHFIRFQVKLDEKTEAGRKAHMTFNRHDEDAENNLQPEVGVSFVDTDYWSYMVGSQCYEEGDQHEETFFVWTREKQPSMYMRVKARNALVALGQEPETMVKGPIVDCWGKDLIM